MMQAGPSRPENARPGNLGDCETAGHETVLSYATENKGQILTLIIFLPRKKILAICSPAWQVMYFNHRSSLVPRIFKNSNIAQRRVYLSRFSAAEMMEKSFPKVVPGTRRCRTIMMKQPVRTSLMPIQERFMRFMQIESLSIPA